MAGIESPSNPVVRDIARAVEARTHFLLEGEKPILEAVAAGIPLEHLLHDGASGPAGSPRSRPRGPGSSRAPCSSGSPTRRRRSTCSRSLAAATCRSPRSSGRPGPVVFLFGVQDPGNLGAIVRVAEAAGAAGVVAAPGSADFFHPASRPRERRQRPADPGLGARLVRAVRGGREGGRALDRGSGRGRRRGSLRRSPRAGVRARGRRRGTGPSRGRVPLPRPAAHDPDAGARRLAERRRGGGAGALRGRRSAGEADAEAAAKRTAPSHRFRPSER